MSKVGKAIDQLQAIARSKKKIGKLWSTNQGVYSFSFRPTGR